VLARFILSADREMALTTLLPERQRSGILADQL
jgi:hypothetical protein